MNRVSPDFQDVRAFHAHFGQPIDVPGVAVELMPEDQFAFRRKFLTEEMDEYGVAYSRGNLVKAVDALIDFVYVACGTLLFMRAPAVFFPTMPWPSFPWVFDQAMRFGYLGGRPRIPGLLSENLHLMVHQRLRHELEMFFLCHNSGESNAVPLSVGHLWNATYAAYLGAVLMAAPWERCWRHVQEANMAKIRARPDGSDSTRQSSWDVVKPAGWCAPDEKIATELTIAGAALPDRVIIDARTASFPRRI